ncbi:pcs-1 [Pristionchus pacificus]|uniref:Glutathione gamma-glutamylcysteinyltransferase n=1 Tax=Pristionchus pacificus TaxID=54126 RepID=A0A2A6CYC0_PRIPA|nr:pcs-1 [Pristionchus pacificus]|eukprot:PDM83086.1 pcs-1 [Pristionchus pacificus]
MSVKAKHFYRRALPDSCVDFASPEGKKMFTEALLEGNASIFFKLSSQFRTQDDPAFCGLSSLVMILNALEVDPGKVFNGYYPVKPRKVWMAPWRFYHETMLDCCVPVDNIKKVGLTLAQVSCLASCNRLSSEMHHAAETEDSITSFRRDVLRSVRGDDVVILASYNRAVLSQTGTGHFSPVAAYHAASDKVLLLDVARFKYPPHWVDLRLFHAAMCSIDRASEKSRGYLNLSLIPNTRPLLMFGLRACVTSSEPQLALACRRFSQCFTDFAISCKPSESFCPKQCSDVETCTLEAVKSITTELRATTPAKLLLSSSVAALLFAFPFDADVPVTSRASRLITLLDAERKSFSIDTLNEIDLLRQQVSTVMCTCKLPMKFD